MRLQESKELKLLVRTSKVSCLMNQKELLKDLAGHCIFHPVRKYPCLVKKIGIIGEEKDARGSIIEISDDQSDLYFVSGSLEVFEVEPKLDELPIGSLSKAAAHW